MADDDLDYLDEMLDAPFIEQKVSALDINCYFIELDL